MNNKIAIITGSSSGFGLHTTLELAKSGFFVIATMRDLAKSEALITELKKQLVESTVAIEQLDVTDEGSINSFQKVLLEKYGKVDVLVNNAGFASGGFVEELSLDTYKKQFDTNLFGVISLTKLVLPVMRKQGSGKIINISSISGLVGFPGLSPYAASKFALEGFTESLRFEVKQFGIDVILVEPGSFQTSIWSKAKGEIATGNNEASPYRELQKAIEKHMEHEDEFGDPKQVAQLITSLASGKNPKFRNVIGKGTKTSARLKRLLPWNSWEKAVLKILGKK